MVPLAQFYRNYFRLKILLFNCIFYTNYSFSLLQELTAKIKKQAHKKLIIVE